MSRLSRCCSCITALFTLTGVFCNAKSIFETANSNISKTWNEQTDDCRPEEFTCSSGQCIEKTLWCDNKRDCNDGSDEPYENCEQNSFSEQDIFTVSGSCVLPEKPDNGDFTINECAHNYSSLICNTVSGLTVPNSTVLSYICDTNYKIKGNEHITCLMGQWSSFINTSCEAVCGRRRSGECGDIPWHVSVFRYTESGIAAKICNGVLVSDSLVVSAAHCFWQYRTFWQFPREFFVILAEEKMDSYTGKCDGKRRKLKEIKFMDNYDPKTLSNDIVLLRLHFPVETTQTVSPICIDWDNIHEKVQLVNGNIGSITVPVSTEDINQNHTFQETQLSFVDFEKCRNEISEQKQFLTEDKFCANNSNNGNHPCSATNGAGLMFETDGLWYLRGIVSKGLSHKHNGPICTNQFIGLTRISDFLDFLKLS